MSGESQDGPSAVEFRGPLETPATEALLRWALALSRGRRPEAEVPGVRREGLELRLGPAAVLEGTRSFPGARAPAKAHEGKTRASLSRAHIAGGGSALGRPSRARRREIRGRGGEGTNGGDSGGEVRRVSTGIPALGEFLSGGTLLRPILLVGGAPASGKIGQPSRCSSHGPDEGKGRSTARRSRSRRSSSYRMQGSWFFDARLADVGAVGLDSLLRPEAADAAWRRVPERVEEGEPALVVLGQTLHESCGSPARTRTLAHDLTAQVASWGATLLVGE